MTENEKKLLEQIYEMVTEMAQDVKELKSEVADFRNEMKGFYSEFCSNQQEIMGGISTWQQRKNLN